MQGIQPQQASNDGQQDIQLLQQEVEFILNQAKRARESVLHTFKLNADELEAHKSRHEKLIQCPLSSSHWVPAGTLHRHLVGTVAVSLMFVCILALTLTLSLQARVHGKHWEDLPPTSTRVSGCCSIPCYFCPAPLPSSFPSIPAFHRNNSFSTAKPRLLFPPVALMGAKQCCSGRQCPIPRGPLASML